MNRWSVRWDMNYDGLFTISDVWIWVKWVYYIPGDLIIAAVKATPLAGFFELNDYSYANEFSLVFSGVFWFLFITYRVAMAEDARRHVKSPRQIKGYPR